MAYHRHKTAPYRRVAKLQQKSARANARLAYRQALQDNPELKKNLLARMWQKQKIKRQYAKAAREAKKRESVQRTPPLQQKRLLPEWFTPSSVTRLYAES